jgi:hypothetical protein
MVAACVCLIGGTALFSIQAVVHNNGDPCTTYDGNT